MLGLRKTLQSGKIHAIWIGLLGLCSCVSKPDTHPDHKAWADSVADRAYNFMSAGRQEQTVAFLDSTYKHTSQRGIADWWRKYNTLADYYENYGDKPYMQEHYIDSMFAILKGREKNYKFEYAHTMYAKAKLLRSKKQFTQAFQYYYDGRNFARENLDNCSLTDFSNQLGNICYQQGQFRKGVPYLLEAFEECTSCRDANFYYSFIIPQSILNTIALCYEKAKMPDSAAFYYQRAMACIDERGKAYPQKAVFIATAKAVVEGNLGGLYSKMGKYALAEEYLLKNIRTNDQPGYAIEDAQTAKCKLADLYMKQNWLVKADSVLTTVDYDLRAGRGKSQANAEVRGDVYLMQSKVFERQNRMSDAYAAARNYYLYRDSIARVNDDIKTTDMDRTFKMQEQQYQISLLKKNYEIKSAYLVALLVFLVMTIVVAWVTARHLRRSRAHVKKLTALNQQLGNAMAALQLSLQDNARMMKIAAHDLRNPIGAMTSVASLLLNDKNRPEKDMAMLQLLKTSGESSLTLVDDLLQVNAHIGEMEKEPIDLEALLQYGIALLQHKADAKHQHIELHAKPVVLNCSRERMWRVISNLIGNAIKFSPNGETIIVSLKQEAGRVLVTVQDRGIGIPDELKDKVFNLFTDAKRKGTAGEPSHGLGLAVSRQIVEAHGGRIWFEPAEDRGTIFFVEFNLVTANIGQAGLAESRA